jgi:hypothetical protein
VDPRGTVATIWVEVAELMAARFPLKLTVSMDAVEPKSVPVIVTVAPGPP